MIKTSHATVSQRKQPFVICTSGNGDIFGSADNVRKDNSLLFARHLNARALLDYLNKYKKKRFTLEPRGDLETTIDRQYDGGYLSLASVGQVMTRRHWKQRNEMEILSTITAIQSHLLKQYEAKSMSNNEEQFNALEMKYQYSYEHIMKQFVNTAIMVNLQYRKRNTIFGMRASDRYCTHMSPDMFNDGLKQQFFKYGGRQTRFGNGKECYRVDNCSNDIASKILCIDYNNGMRLEKTDNFGWTFYASNVTLKYSMTTLKLSITYSITYDKNGRKHRRA